MTSTAHDSERPLHAMSIDVEDWYHSLDPEPSHWSGYEHRVVESTRIILRIFERTGTRATFFVLGHVAQRAPGLVAEIRAGGHEIGTHGYAHRFIHHQSPDEFADDLRRSMDLISGETGEAVRGYRAPYFSITRRTLWALSMLRDMGMEYDSSIHPVHNHRYGIPDWRRDPHEVSPGLVEVPISTYPIGGANIPCGGGVYFRGIPRAVLFGMLRRLEERGERIVFYLHPWEVDPGHPRLRVNLGLRLRHYHGLSRAAAKLERLARAFRWGTIADAIGLNAGSGRATGAARAMCPPG